MTEGAGSNNLHGNEMCQCLYKCIPNMIDLPLVVHHKLDLITNSHIVDTVATANRPTYLCLAF